MGTSKTVALALLVLLPAVAAGEDAKTAEPKWVNVTNNVGGESWGYAGVCTIACVPGQDEVIAGVSERGLWSSTDGGATWKKLGADDKVQIANRPHQIVFDPKDPKTFWLSGNYGAGVFKTTDGGKSFQQLGKLNHVDGLGVDFGDKDRKTLVIGHHEAARSIEKSTDGGKTWENIGKNLPENTNHSTDTVVFDANTFVVNTAGWAQGKSWGIYRTEDGGATWAKVSDLGPSGTPLVTSDGTIFWQLTWGGGLVKSADKGKTWEKIAGPVKSNVIEIPASSKLGGAKGAILGLTEAKVYLSRDGGKTWSALGGQLPIKPSRAAYDEKRNCIFISRSSDKKTDDAIFRWDLPAESQDGPS
jgi:photosystem II stability/assembly factor-like uncharacterized protein